MKQPFTILFRLLLLALAWAPNYTAWGQTYTPVALTGFTHDIIANGTGAVSATTTADIDGAAATGGTGYCLMAQNYVGPTGQVPNSTTYPFATYPALENNGLITSVLNSAITYQLADYSANNALRLYGAAASGTLAFATPSPAAELYVIGTSGGAASILDITVTFSDGTTQLFPSQTISDWFATGLTNVVREKLGRVSRGDNSVQYTSSPVGPRFYQLKLVLDAANVTKNIASIGFVKPLVGGTTVLLAVTAGTYPICTVTPSALTVAATTTSGGTTALTTACSSTNIYLALSGVPTNQAGIAIQWQSSSNNTAWTNISGATSSTYNAIGQTAATYYRAVVTCLYGGGTAVNTASVQVNQSAFDACYCSPSSSNGCATYAQLLKVEIPGTTLSNTSTCSASPYYTNYAAAATTTATLSPGTSYPMSITLGRYAKAGMWVDYDHSGTFDASEYTVIGTNSTNTAGSTATVTPTLVIPSTALSGTTRMRVRTQYFLVSTTYPLDGTSACISTTYGESEDYTITIAPSVACTGTPPTITATSSAASICGGTAFTLTASGVAAGTSGLTYQWQSSPTGTNTFTNLGTAQTSAFYTVASQSAATDYRVIVTCTASALSATSNTVAVAQNAFMTCYCTPVTSGTGTDGITNVTLGVLNNSSSATNTTPYYTDYSTPQTAGTLPVPVLFPGGSTTVSITMGSDGTQYSGVWIDFDHNGLFDATEFFSLATSAGGNGTSVIPITIPAGALLGLTKMRVRGGNDVVLLNSQACTAASSTSNYGEVEDYLVNIAVPIACTGTPATTVAVASATSACAAVGFTLNATGVVAGTSGLTYQWQSSPTGTNTFTNLGTAQATPSYTVTSQPVSSDYRVVVTCTASNLSATSSLVTVTRTYLSCYCAPQSGTAGEYIKGVTLPGTPGFTNTTGTTTSTNGYGDFTASTTLTTTVNQGATYVDGVGLTVRSNNTNSQGGMWIDYDHSGTFDASEYSLIGTSSAIATDVAFLNTLVVPATALLGQTRVRVRWRNGGFAATDACVTGTTTWYGETEDYLITIAAPTTCSAPPATVVASADATNACANASFTLSTSSIPTTLGGYTYQWQSRVGTAAFANITGATTNPYVIASQTVATDYRLVVGCQYGGTPVNSNTVSVGQNSFNQCYCTASSTNVCSNYGVITNISLGTITNPTGCTSTDSYASYTNLSTDLIPGAASTLTLGVASATTTFNYNYGVWIDFNHNGTFDTSEFIANSTAALSATSTGITLNIPALSSTVLAGATRMRVRTNAGIASYGIFNAGLACGAVYNGETEDYTVNILSCTATTAAFNYGTGSSFCVSGTTNPAVVLATGSTAGTYSSSTGLTLNPTTGAITLSSSTPGTYIVTNTVPTNATQCGSTSTTTVTITAAPTASFTYPTATVCAGTAATVTPTAATGATLGSFTLPTATGLSINATTGVVTVGATAVAGTYTVTNTVAAASGCAAVTSTSTFAITAPTTATFSYPAATYCVSGTTNPTATVTGTAGGSFSSATGLSISTTTGAITLSSSTPGTYTVTYTVSGTCGSTSTQSVTITAPAAASFSYATPATGTACVGSTGSFLPTVTGTSGTFSVTPAGVTVNATTGAIAMTGATAGTYTITNTVAASGGCAAATSTATFTVNALPATPTLTVTGTPSTGITLTSSVATGNQFLLNGNSVTGATGTTYFINSGTRNGTYTVQVTNAAGCTATSAAVSVAVTATTSALAGTSLIVSPNPTPDGRMVLEMSGYRETVSLRILNALGQRVYEGTVTGSALNQKQLLNLTALPTGVYILQARTASGNVEVRRIVRE